MIDRDPPTLSRVRYAVAAASRVKDPLIKGMHLATARALHDSLKDGVDRLGKTIEAIEHELARTLRGSLPPQGTMPGADDRQGP